MEAPENNPGEVREAAPGGDQDRETVAPAFGMPTDPPEEKSGSDLRIATGVLILLALAGGYWWMHREPTPAAATTTPAAAPAAPNAGALADAIVINEAAARKTPTPQNYLNLSLAYYRAGRNGDTILAAKEALKLKPNYAEALNNIGAAYNSMGLWDEGIAALQEALKIMPDFQLAKNNLAWAQSQKAKSPSK